MNVLKAIRRPILSGGLALLIAGGTIAFFGGGHGRIRLITGIPEGRLVTGNSNKGDTTNLGFSMVLDSIRAEAIEPDYKLLVWAVDTSGRSHAGKSTLFTGLVDAFPLDTMVIRKVGDSDYRFRLVEYFPDFTFAYAYGADKRATPPVSPGITIDLKTPGGTAITTLRTDQPGKYKLDDLVNLGCSLEYHWSVDADSLDKAVSDLDQPASKVLFSGMDSLVYFLFSGELTRSKLSESQFYPLPGNTGLGFTVLVHFPDAAFLKAVPTTASDKPNRPVGQVEVWKTGERATEVFLYPSTKGRIGGDHRIRGTNALLTLGESPKDLLRRSVIHLRTGDPEAEREAIVLENGKGLIHRGKYILPISCHAEYPGSVVLSIRALTGFWLALPGMMLVLFAVFLRLRYGPATAQDEKDQRTQ